jgi:deoxyribodipyrimidine photo-lyase
LETSQNAAYGPAIVWMRRDLRLYDHHAMALATLKHQKVQLIFNFDPHILNQLEDKCDQRVMFIRESLVDLESKLKQKNPQASLLIIYGPPEIEIPKLAKELGATHVYTNEDYEPYAKARDQKVALELKNLGIPFTSVKDQVVFRGQEVLSKEGRPLKVFTAYKNVWMKLLSHAPEKLLQHYQVKTDHLATLRSNTLPIADEQWWKIIKMQPTKLHLPAGTKGATELWKEFDSKIAHYHERRDLPADEGTSLLSVHLRHGTVSIRHLIRKLWKREDFAAIGVQTWLSELIWREFYQGILDLNPQVASGSYKPAYDQIHWLGSDEFFARWCEGMTGYPIIDAGMRALNQTGLMPNRVRMIVASFLCKTLLVDWKKGEAYFAKKLLDFDLAANNGGWQWCASTGTDAQPYFRIFNPYNQSEKFDPSAKFIKTYCPELAPHHAKDIHAIHQLNGQYPSKIVEYEPQRARALEMYSVVKTLKNES